MDLNDLALRLTVCPRCEALPGNGCVTISGTRSSRLHSSRTGPLYDAWRDGYREARTDAAAWARRVYDTDPLAPSLTIVEAIERSAR